MKKTVFILFIFLAKISWSQHIGTRSGEHTIVVKASGLVYTWGYNNEGELGNANNTTSNVPEAVSTSGVLSGKTITQVAGGYFHSIVLASDGTVFTWGGNNAGQLGNGNNTNSNVPVAVSTSGVLSGKTITQVAGGLYHSIVLASDGTVYTWATNSEGQLGNGNNTSSNVPVAVTANGALLGKTITQIAAGAYHSIVLASDGTVYTWGYNADGQLGNTSNTNSNVPVAVSTSGVLSGKTITQIAAGGSHSIVLASDGTVYTWGLNTTNGQLGNGNFTNSNIPVAVITSGVLNGKIITQVSAGESHSMARGSDGMIYTWGRNNHGALGNGNNTNSNVPVSVIANGALLGKTITQVAAGGHHSIARASDGTIYTWGYNGRGQLGNNSITSSNVPVAVYQVVMGLLPLQWHSFNAKKLNKNVLLEWATAQEQNTKDFIVQHSTNGTDWKNIGSVIAAGNSNTIKAYSHLHTTPIKSNNYYRILQRDLDGKSSYSEVRMVKLQNTIDKFQVNGNPVVNGQLNVTILSTCIVNLHSTDGTILWSKQFVAGSQSVDMSKYAKGIYFLKAAGQSEQIVVQ